MKIVIVGALFFSVFFTLGAFALEISSPQTQRSFSTVLIKKFRTDGDMSGSRDGQIQEVKIVLRTNPHESDRGFDHRRFHELFKTTLERKYGWQTLLFPISDREYLNAELGLDPVALAGELIAYKPLRSGQGQSDLLTPVVDVDLGMAADIDLNFPARNELVILAALSVLGESPLWNTMKYRGEPMEEYVREVLDNFEEKLKENYNLREEHEGK
ncbi:MAG: hypothetical protein JXR40_00560 [Pontiellaceae bacterium]|nr:hypothetical protein [Pontiellaceae bacterium]